MDEILQQLKVSSIEQAFQQFLLNPKPTPTERSLIAELLQTVPVKEILRETSGFVCPLLNTAIAAPCRLTACQYHVKFEYAANCLLQYSEQQKTDKVTVDEQAYLYGLSPRALQRLYDNAELKIRAEAFREWAEMKDLPTFRFYPTKRLCCVCESVVIDQVFAGGQIYCSHDCMHEKMPAKVKLERMFGLLYEQLQIYLPQCFNPEIASKILT